MISIIDILIEISSIFDPVSSFFPQYIHTLIEILSKSKLKNPNIQLNGP